MGPSYQQGLPDYLLLAPHNLIYINHFLVKESRNVFGFQILI